MSDSVLGPMFMSAREIVNTYRLGDAKLPQQTLSVKESLLKVKAALAEGPSKERWEGQSAGVAASIRSQGYSWSSPVVINHDSPHGPAVMNGHHRLAYMYENHPDEPIPLNHYSAVVAPVEQAAVNSRQARRFRQVLETRGEAALPDSGFPGWRSRPHLVEEHARWSASQGV